MTSPPNFDELLHRILHDLSSLTTEVNQIRTRMGPHGFQLADPPPPPHFSPASIKLEIPTFNGSDPLGWITSFQE